MAKHKRGSMSGKKAGSIVDAPIDPKPAGKQKAKKPRKQSRGK